MGIQGLTARLTAYGKPVTWLKRKDASDTSEKSDSLIIDGPALAYHVYYQCLASNTSARNAFEALPLYQDISDTLVCFLGELESFGLSIEHIYFDGHLPEYKVGVRHERLRSYLTQLRSFRATHSEPCRPEIQATRNDTRRPVGSTALGPHGKAPARATALPALPFLVPTVIETLRSRDYPISVVPGEADVYCARHVSTMTNAYVLSSDSDLLVHCHDGGKIIFFNDLDPSDESKLKARCFKPSDIAASFNCADIRDIAYPMALDTQLSASEASRKAHRNRSNTILEAQKWYASELNVSSGFSRTLERARLQTTKGLRALAQVLSELSDPRLSELICDWTIKTQDSNELSYDAHMYLHFLIDDPNRASAWRASFPVRQIAYCALQFESPVQTIYEIDRRGDKISNISVQVPSVHELLTRWRVLRTSFQEHVKSHGGQLQAAVLATLRSIEETDLPMPDLDMVLAVVGDSATLTSWGAVHFKAQVEGYWYSLRMLGMILEECISQDSWVAWGQMDRTLIGLPSNPPLTPSFLTSSNMPLGIPDIDGSFRKALHDLYITSEEEEQRKKDLSKTSKRERKTKRRKVTKEMEVKVESSHNMFTILPES